MGQYADASAQLMSTNRAGELPAQPSLKNKGSKMLLHHFYRLGMGNARTNRTQLRIRSEIGYIRNSCHNGVLLAYMMLLIAYHPLFLLITFRGVFPYYQWTYQDKL